MKRCNISRSYLRNLLELKIYGLPINDELLEQLHQALPNTKMSPVKVGLGR